MTQPLALLLCEKLLIGRQLATRLQDMDYRVQSVAGVGSLVETAAREKPLLIIANVQSDRDQVCPVIADLRANPVTAHIPVIVFTAEGKPHLQAAAREAGATLVVTGTAMSTHLNQLLDQALALD
jgi:CheY-like chemotaxis protein